MQRDKFVFQNEVKLNKCTIESVKQLLILKKKNERRKGSNLLVGPRMKPPTK